MIYALALTGPTASGKTALSLSVAESLSAEIISCDSMQIYKRMDIGTAKATAEERARVPHHMIDFLSPSENYSAEDYRRDAVMVAGDISARGKLPLFVGGTGLYIDTVMRGEMSSPPSDSVVRRRLMDIAERDGADILWDRLVAIDPLCAEKMHKNNIRRVVRALEIYEVSGRTKSYYDELSKTAGSDIRIGMITLDFHNRDNLYRRVDSRVDAMLAEGLLDEVRSLYNDGLLMPEYTASQAIGYKEVVSYLRGECTLDEARELLKMSSRRYAKRQLTWFRHEEGVLRLYLDGEDGIMKNSETIEREAIKAAWSLLENIKRIMVG